MRLSFFPSNAQPRAKILRLIHSLALFKGRRDIRARSAQAADENSRDGFLLRPSGLSSAVSYSRFAVNLKVVLLVPPPGMAVVTSPSIVWPSADTWKSHGLSIWSHSQLCSPVLVVLKVGHIKMVVVNKGLEPSRAFNFRSVVTPNSLNPRSRSAFRSILPSGGLVLAMLLCAPPEVMVHSPKGVTCDPVTLPRVVSK